MDAGVAWLWETETGLSEDETWYDSPVVQPSRLGKTASR